MSRPWRNEGSASIRIAAPPGIVYDQVADVSWSRTCEIIQATPGACFAFRTVPERWDPSRNDSTIWRYTLTPDGDGTLVTHDYRIVKPPLACFKWLYGRLLPHHRDMRPHLQHTLDALARELGAPAARSSASGRPAG
jgi:hypothetical protein